MIIKSIILLYFSIINCVNRTHRLDERCWGQGLAGITFSGIKTEARINETNTQSSSAGIIKGSQSSKDNPGCFAGMFVTPSDDDNNRYQSLR